MLAAIVLLALLPVVSTPHQEQPRPVSETSFSPPEQIVRVNVASDGAQAEHGNPFSLSERQPKQSADGRLIVFYSEATNLGLMDPGWPGGVYLRDLETSETRRVDLPAQGLPDGVGQNADISADGSLVVFDSSATNLVAAPASDIYLFDTATNALTSVDLPGEGYTPSWLSELSLSANGRYLVFSTDQNLLTGGYHNHQQIYRHDLVGGGTDLVSVRPDGGLGDGASFAPDVTDDGELVVFSSSANNLAPVVSTWRYDTFIRHMSTGVIEVLGANALGDPGNDGASPSRIAADGSAAVIETQSTNIVSGQGTWGCWVIHIDLDTGVRTLVSPNGMCAAYASMSDDGSTVAYVAAADDGQEIVVWRAATGESVNVTRGANNSGYWTDLTADGSRVAFVSKASNLIRGDTNNSVDVFAVGTASNADAVVVPPDVNLGQTFGPTGTNTLAVNPTGCCQDPVNTATGSFFGTWHDLALGGAGVTFDLARSYNSADTTAGVLGTGWVHAYESALTVVGNGNVIFRGPNGQQVEFLPAGGGAYVGGPGVRATLVKAADGSFTVTAHDLTRLSFDPGGRLTRQVDRSGVGLAMTYTAGRLSAVMDAAGRSVAFAYSAEGLLGSVSLPDGRHTDYGYIDGRLASVTDARGQATTFTYDGGGRLASATDPLGHQPFRNTYDSGSGRITSQLNARNGQSTFGWNPTTLTATITDPRGGITQHAYWPANVLMSVTNPVGGVTNYEYDLDLNVTAVTDPNGNRTAMTYDEADNVLTRTAPAPLGYVETFTYTGSNDPASYVNRRGKTTTFQYDATDRLTTVTDAAAGVTRLDYTALGQVETVTDARTGVTTYGYDSAGNLTSVRTPLGKITSYGYDSSGRPTSVVDPRGNEVAANPAEFTSAISYNAIDQVLTSTDQLGHVTTRTYDLAGRLASVTDAAGRMTSYGYDNDANITAITAPDLSLEHRAYDAAGNLSMTTTATGSITSYGFDLAGQMTSMTTPRGNVSGADSAAFTWTYAYDPAGNRITASHPSAGTTTTAFDVLNRPVTVTDALSQATNTAYDANNNPLTVTDPTSAVTTTGYDNLDRPITITDPLSHTTTLTYDAMGNRTSETTPLGHITRWTYDADQRQTAMIDPRGNVTGGNSAAYTTSFGYDATGQLLSIQNPLGHVSRTEYDRTGNVSARIDANNHRTRYGYDVLNRLATVTSPEFTTGPSTSYDYDTAGNLTTRTDAKNHVTSYDYDDDRRLTEITDPLQRRTVYNYDPDGNITSAETPLGTATPVAGDGTVAAGYDPLGRRSSIDYSDSTPDVTYDYDPLGRVTSMADGAGSGSTAQTYSYDPLDRLQTVTRGTTDYDYDYDTAGRLTRRTYPDGTVVDLGHDDDDRLTTLTTGGATTTLGYDPAGQLTSTTLPATTGHTEGRTYDAAGRLTQIATTAGSTALSRYALTYDPAGNPTSRVTTRGLLSSTEHYSYDAADRLVTACTDPGCGQLDLNTITYSYDPVGNRTAQTHPGRPLPVSTSYSYDAADQLTSTTSGNLLGNTTTNYGYDTNGQQTAAGPRSYTWGLDERLRTTTAGATTTSYTYDGDGRRLTEATNGSTTTRYGWDLADPLPMLALETDAAGATLRSYLNRPATPVGMSSGGSAYYYAHDNIGSITDVLSGSGAAQWRNEYEPFGTATINTKLVSTAPANPARFNGQYLDSSTDLYHLRARQYDPNLGRMLSTDPLSPQLTDPYVSSYVYANNRPGLFGDPTGESALDVVKGIAQGAYTMGKDSTTLWYRAQYDPLNLVQDVVSNTRSDYRAAGGGLRGAQNAFNNNFNPVNEIMAGAGVLAGGGNVQEAACLITRGTFSTGLALAGGGAASRAWTAARAAEAGGGPLSRLRSFNWADDTGSWGRGGQKLSPDDAAGGAPHTTFRRGPDGGVSHYVEWTPNARSPRGYDIAKRYDGVGGSHYDRLTGVDVPTPHVQGPWGVRSAEPWEIPR